MNEFEELLLQLIEAANQSERAFFHFFGEEEAEKWIRKTDEIYKTVLAAYEQEHKWAAAWKQAAKFWRDIYYTGHPAPSERVSMWNFWRGIYPKMRDNL